MPTQRQTSIFPATCSYPGHQMQINHKLKFNFLGINAKAYQMCEMVHNHLPYLSHCPGYKLRVLHVTLMCSWESCVSPFLPAMHMGLKPQFPHATHMACTICEGIGGAVNLHCEEFTVCMPSSSCDNFPPKL